MPWSDQQARRAPGESHSGIKSRIQEGIFQQSLNYDLHCWRETERVPSYNDVTGSDN